MKITVIALKTRIIEQAEFIWQIWDMSRAIIQRASNKFAGFRTWSLSPSLETIGLQLFELERGQSLFCHCFI